jgi:Mg2+-importing ATPase
VKLILQKRRLRCRAASVTDEADLTFAGFLVFLDPPKSGAREALTELANLRFAVKVVTGDKSIPPWT